MSPRLLRASGFRPMDWLVAPKLARRSQVQRLAPRRSRDASWSDPLLQFWIRHSLTDGRSLLQGYTIRHGYQRRSELFSFRDHATFLAAHAHPSARTRRVERAELDPENETGG